MSERAKISLDLVRTDAKDLISPEFASQFTSLSPDGSMAYIVYPGFTAGTTVAQFLKNNSGRLTVVRSITTDDPTFPGVDSGYANPCFNQFSLVKEDITTGVAQIQILNIDGSILFSRIFSDVFVDPTTNFAVVTGGRFSPDGRYLLFLYTLNTSSATDLRFVLRVLAVQKGLPTVGTYVFPVGQRPGRTDPKFFNLNGYENVYFIELATTKAPFEVVNVADGVGAAVQQYGCPSYLQVLAFSPGFSTDIVLVDQAYLPAPPAGLDAWPKATCVDLTLLKEKKCKSSDDVTPFAMLAVNTLIAVNSSEVSPYKFATPSCTPDASELRLYAFDGHKLFLAATQNNDLRGLTVGFTPDGEYLLSIYQTIRGIIPEPIVEGVPSTPLGFSSILQISKTPLKQLKKIFSKKKNKSKICATAPLCLDITRIKGGVQGAFDISISDDSNWVLIAGGGVSEGTISNGAYLVQLFRTICAPC